MTSSWQMSGNTLKYATWRQILIYKIINNYDIISTVFNTQYIYSIKWTIWKDAVRKCREKARSAPQNRSIEFSKLFHFMATYPQTLLMSQNDNAMIVKVKKINKYISKSNIPCLPRLLETFSARNFFIFSRSGFFSLEK